MNSMFAYYSILFNLSKGHHICVVSPNNLSQLRLKWKLESDLSSIGKYHLLDNIDFRMAGERRGTGFSYYSYITDDQLDELRFE